MANEKMNSDGNAESSSSSSSSGRGVGWDDPHIPIGNAPPVGKTPLILFSLAWVGWIVFLAMMIVQ